MSSKKQGKKGQGRVKKKRDNLFQESREKWNELSRDIEKTHRCGKIYQKAHDYAIWPLKQFKKTPIYGGMKKIAEKNRDYVFLAKVIGLLATGGIIYYLYTVLTRGPRPIFTVDSLVSRLTTMDVSDLPMSESANVKAEVEALNCHKTYFNKNPYSIENTGAYDMARGVISLIITIFLWPTVVIFSAIYVVWFMYNYFFKYIAPAIYGFIIEVMIEYMVRFVVCKVASIIPFFSFRCPSLYKYIRKWRVKYIDGPVYKEKMKYFRFYYLNKKRFYEKPKKKYFDQNWEKGKIRADYGNKFMTRSRDIFYNKVMSSQEYVDKGTEYISQKADQARQGVSQATSKVTDRVKDLDFDTRHVKASWEKAEEKVDQLYSTKNLIISLLLLVISLGVLYFFTYYNITGKPASFFDLIGPLYRSTDIGNRVKFLSSRYNWLYIGLILVLVVGLFYHTYQNSTF